MFLCNGRRRYAQELGGVPCGIPAEYAKLRGICMVQSYSDREMADGREARGARLLLSGWKAFKAACSWLSPLVIVIELS